MIITIPEGIDTIPAKLYMDEMQVTEFVLPASLETIGEQAFSVYTDMTPTLKRFTVHEDNKNFKEIDGVLTNKKGDKLIAFPLARSGTYEVPKGIKVIGKYAFRMAINLTSIILPDSVEKIEKGAFYYCKALKTITMGNGCKIIGAGAFEACSALSEVHMGNSLQTIQKKAFCKCGSCGTITFSKQLKELAAEAFYGMDNTHFIFQGIPQRLGERAFVGKNLSLTITKKAEKLLIPELFAMNGKRKFSVTINFADTRETIVMAGKLGDFYPKEQEAKPIKTLTPKLISEVEGTLVNREKKCIGQYLAVGFNKYGQSNALSGQYTHIARITPSGIQLKSLAPITPELLMDYNVSWDGEKIKTKIYQGMATPNVYSIDDDNFILDLSYIDNYGCWQSQNHGHSFSESFVIHERKTCFSFWRINLLSDEAVSITKEEFDRLNLRADYEAYEQKAHSYIAKVPQKEHESYSDYYKRLYKESYGTFTVPDSEESMDRFFEDSNGNIFNYGSCIVYNKSCKGCIDSRKRSYVNMYSKTGELLAKIKLKGSAAYMMERDGYHFILTQQDMQADKPAMTRLYRLEL